MKFKTILYFTVLALLIACSKKDEIDTEKPVISLDFADVFPVNCDTIYFGESFTLKIKLSDNEELGTYSYDVHNNFDHHTHTTEVSICDEDEIKEAVNPYVVIDDYDIPDGQTEYETNLTVSIPSGNAEGLYDEGDYHFFLSLTDAEGWSTQKGLSIKMFYR